MIRSNECLSPGCGLPTSEGKPRCEEHLGELPYVAQLLARESFCRACGASLGLACEVGVKRLCATTKCQNAARPKARRSAS
jgi:hypothetical protein